MIVGNGVRLISNPNRYFDAPVAHTTVRSGWNMRGALMNLFTAEGVSKKEGIPSGARNPHVWLLPRVAGGLASRNNVLGGSGLSGNLAGGVAGVADLEGVGAISLADGGIIAALVAALAGAGVVSEADISAIVYAEIEALLSGYGAVVTAETSSLLFTAAVLAGSGDVPTASLQALGLALADLAGSGSAAGSASAKGFMGADISLGASLELSPESVASSVKQALMGAELDGYTLEDIIKLTSSVLLGKSSGGSNPVFRSLDDTAVRVSGEVDPFGNRVESVLSP